MTDHCKLPYLFSFPSVRWFNIGQFCVSLREQNSRIFLRRSALMKGFKFFFPSDFGEIFSQAVRWVDTKSVINLSKERKNMKRNESWVIKVCWRQKDNGKMCRMEIYWGLEDLLVCPFCLGYLHYGKDSTSPTCFFIPHEAHFPY